MYTFVYEVRIPTMSWRKLGALYLLLTTNLALIESRASSSESPQCKDENNRPVDWFVMYKIPKIRETSEPLIRKGISYLYMTSQTVAQGWKLSQKDVTMKNSMLGYTLSSLYNDDVASDLMWVMYNDAPPNKNVNAKYGHAKGVVTSNGKQGSWLIHSVPGFPTVPRTGESAQRHRSTADDVGTKTEKELTDGEYGYPDSGKQNGQSLICITVDADQMDIIGRQLMYNEIVVYRKNLPQKLATKFPVFVNASNQVRIKNAPWTNKATIRSSAGLEFTSFAKSDKWQRDLYDDFVGPQLNSDLFAETWLNGRGRLPSECNGSRVMNVESVVLAVANVDFKSSHDHSKWAVSTGNGKNGNWVCVGDINRADTQFNRGGGTLCLKSPELWQSYRNAVNDVEACPKKVGVFHKVKNWFKTKFG